MITFAVLAAGAALALTVLAWSTYRAATGIRHPEPLRCAGCGQPVVGQQLFCDAACQLLWETTP